MAVKILFCFYPLFVRWNQGIALLSATCKERGVETSLYLLENPDKFADYLMANPPDYLGFSCVTVHDYRLSLPFMAVAKESRVPTLLGGVYPRRGSPLDAPVDYICRGEAEWGLPDFLLTGNTRVFEEKRIFLDLNLLPIPDYDLFAGIPYNRRLPFWPEATILPYSSSRGCPYRCFFCESALQPPGVRIRTRVKEDLAFLTGKYRPDVICFSEELLPYYSRQWRESWEEFEYPFVSYIRADITEDQLIWLQAKGLRGCFFGVESGNEQYRNMVLGKQLSDKNLMRTVGLLREMQIPYVAFYIRGAPQETWKIQGETVWMSREIGGYPVFCRYENLKEL